MRVLIALIVLLFSVPALAQVKNPRLVTFLCADHALDTGHEIDIINAQGAVVQTLEVGDPPLNAAGEVEVVLNVQPVAFGLYTVVARSVSGVDKSANSLPSEVWQRTQMAPGKPKVGG